MVICGRIARLLLCATLASVTVTSWRECVSAQSSDTITVQDLAALRDLDGLSLSPNGAWAAFQVRQANARSNRYDTAWYVVALDTGTARRISDGGEPIQLSVSGGRVNGYIRTPPPTWSPDSVWIAYLRKDGGQTQIWRSRRDGLRTEQLTHSEGDARSLVYSSVGRRLLFETEPSRAQIERALEQERREGFLYDARFYPDYDRIPVLPTAQDPAHQIWAYDFASRRERLAGEAERLEFAAATASQRTGGRPATRGTVAFSPGGARAWAEARDPEHQGGFAPLTIIAQPAMTSEPIVCDAQECTGQRVEALWWRNETELIFARREGALFAETALYSWQLNGGAPRLILRTRDRLMDCSAARDELVCFYEQPNYPRRLVSFNLATGFRRTIYDPNPSFVRFDLGPPPQHLAIASDSDAETYAYLVLPPGHHVHERLPLVIVTYRCAGFLRGGSPGDEYPIYPLAAAGFAVLCFNTPIEDYDRLLTEDRSANEKWARGPGDPIKRRVQEALDGAVDQLNAMGLVDPRRVALTGLSYGAETVSFALFNMRRLAAAIASGAEIGPSSTYLYSRSGRATLRAWGLGAPGSHRWQALSLAMNAERVRAPLLMNVADRELIAALPSVAALEDADRAVEMYVFPDEYHVKWQPAHRLAIYNRNIDWMNFWLRGVENPAPAKVEQYKRWRAMRVKQCELFKGDDAPWYC